LCGFVKVHWCWLMEEELPMAIAKKGDNGRVVRRQTSSATVEEQ